MKLPDYNPPPMLSACMAVAVCPLVVLQAFGLVLFKVVDADIGLAILVACIVWVLYQMHHYQADVDAYDQAYVQQHLAWRTPAMLPALAAQAGASAATRRFVLAHLQQLQQTQPPPDLAACTPQGRAQHSA